MSKTPENQYVSGDRLVTCDICGFTYRRSQIRRGIAQGQQGLLVCPEDFDTPHPLDDRKPPRAEEGPVEII
jgi:hypothetical protein